MLKKNKRVIPINYFSAKQLLRGKKKDLRIVTIILTPHRKLESQWEKKGSRKAYLSSVVVLKEAVTIVWTTECSFTPDTHEP